MKYQPILTPQDMVQYREDLMQSADKSIDMYIKHFVHKRTYRDIGEEYGISKQRVEQRVRSLIGQITAFRGHHNENNTRKR